MKISQQLPQFNDTDVLIVTMGSHHGIIYRGKDGEVEKLDEIRVDDPIYSDKEGAFGVGGVLDPTAEFAINDFSKQLAVKVTEHVRDGEHSHIYLFAPSEMKQHIEKDWTTDAKAMILHRFDGNYVSKSLNDLIAMIDEQGKVDNPNPATGEAKKILDMNS